MLEAGIEATAWARTSCLRLRHDVKYRNAVVLCRYYF